MDEKLDDLIVQNLELMEEKVAATVELEKSLRNAQIELAKARLIRGKEAIGPSQIPIHSENISSLFELESVMTEQNGCSVPQFDISLKQDSDNSQNPLKWFGILVPQSLKSAKKYFQDSVYLSVKVANVQAKLITVLNEIESVRKIKQSEKL